MSDPIAPCPFCGNAASSRLDTITDADAWVYCDACSACGPTKRTEAEAVAAWNATSARARAPQFATTTTADLYGSPPCPACGRRALAWGPTVGMWACMECKSSFRVLPSNDPAA
jgi:Lar family restriction alleviation protein